MTSMRPGKTGVDAREGDWQGGRGGRKMDEWMDGLRGGGVQGEKRGDCVFGREMLDKPREKRNGRNAALPHGGGTAPTATRARPVAAPEDKTVTEQVCAHVSGGVGGG